MTTTPPTTSTNLVHYTYVVDECSVFLAALLSPALTKWTFVDALSEVTCGACRALVEHDRLRIECVLALREDVKDQS